MADKNYNTDDLNGVMDEFSGDSGDDVDRIIRDIRRELQNEEPEYPESTPDTNSNPSEFHDQEYLDTFGDSLPDVFADETEDDDLEEEDTAPMQPKQTMQRSRKHAPRNKKKKRRGSAVFMTFSTVIYIVMVAAVALLLAKFAWLCADDVLALTTEDRTVTVTIEDGATLNDIADTLYDAGLIKYPWLFKIYGSYAHAADRVGAGVYELNNLFDYHALLNGLSSSASLSTTEVTVIEGYSCKQVFQQLADAGICTVEELEDTAANYKFDYWFVKDIPYGESNRLEGYLYPDTYEFYTDQKPEAVLAKFLDNFEKRMDTTIMDQVQKSGYTLRQIITVASMIEEEAASEEERSNIASVIYNRLESDKLPYLQLDSTVYYAADLIGGKFDTEIDSPYNTYRNKGLPAGPIDNPGLSSIKAALNPAQTDYYYFAYGTDGVSHFYTDFDSFSEFLNSDQYAG